MIFLINASNLKNGGGLQVAQSICEQLSRYTEHHFILVLSSSINDANILASEKVEIHKYNLQHNFKTVLLGRDSYLDGLVEEKHVDAVLTVFGPSLWRPRVPHLCGFARAQLLLKVKGYRLTARDKILYKIWTWAFRRSSDTFYTENAFISDMLPKLIRGAKVYTVTNYYNQVFDQPERWKKDIELPTFDGVTLLTVSSTAPHKNLSIMVPVAEFLKHEHPDINFRFVLTCDDVPFQIPDNLRKHFSLIGKVEVAECPNLYRQADIMFMPTLMECFTATYPEAMRMEVPIVTTDLEFARGLCGKAACYYSAVNPADAAEEIYKVATDKDYAQLLIEDGKKQLLLFDNYEQRARKLINILEEIVN